MLLKDYLDSLSVATATPGGGSASALAGAMGAALGEMVCGISSLKAGKTANKKLIRYKKIFHKNYNKLFSLSEKDCLAYQKVLEAYKLPKNTPARIRRRNARIQKALLQATFVPLNGIEISIENVKALVMISRDLKDSVKSDFIVALLLSNIAIIGCEANAAINMELIKGIKDIDKVKKLLACLIDSVKKSLSIQLKTWL
jgi:formiminotetrahydrofolate cyclodeaminase